LLMEGSCCCRIPNLYLCGAHCCRISILFTCNNGCQWAADLLLGVISYVSPPHDIDWDFPHPGGEGFSIIYTTAVVANTDIYDNKDAILLTCTFRLYLLAKWAPQLRQITSSDGMCNSTSSTLTDFLQFSQGHILN
jgi:hypothetical protein